LIYDPPLAIFSANMKIKIPVSPQNSVPMRKGVGMFSPEKRSLPVALLHMVLAGVLTVCMAGASATDDGKIIVPDLQPAVAGLGVSGRSFRMGFTTWPVDATVEGVEAAYAFINKHADITAIHLDGGVPWQEMLDKKPFPKHIQDDFKHICAHRSAANPLYVATTPLNFGRTGLADYRDTAENQPLPAAWRGLSLNDPKVKRAYLTYLQGVVEQLRPDYLAVGIEVNILLAKNEAQWKACKELNSYVYGELKKLYPGLPVFVTVQYEYLKGVETGSRHNRQRQEPEVRELMKYSDFLGLSSYQYGPLHHAVPTDYFDMAATFGKPVALAESGAISQTLHYGGVALTATPADQENFEKVILSAAQRGGYVFVIGWTGMDFDRLINRLPASVREIAGIWVHTGLADAQGTPKLALGIWDTYFKAPLKQ
jgi:hypothetical protein